MTTKEPKGQVINLAKHDHRIDALCRAALPGHPHVALFVARELRNADASVLVARIVCEQLAKVHPEVSSSHQRVDHVRRCLAREGVYRDTMAWLRTHDDGFLDLSTKIISTIICAKERVELLAKLDEGQRPTTRPPLAIRGDKDAAADFTIIFNRAYVMLRDVPAQVLEREAHKTARNA
jgi:hypothetical protein